MEKLLLSIQGCRVLPFIFKKQPSNLIPFKGEFPILDDYKEKKVMEQIHAHRYLDECEDWMQKAVLKADRIYLMHSGSEDYLSGIGKLKTFNSLSASDKSTLLIKFMDENCLGLDSLKIE